MSTLTKEQRKEIVKIAKSFAKGFKPDFPSINGTGFFIVDPMSGYLNALGYENKLDQLPATSQHPQVLIMTFCDGSQLIPAGGDLKAIYPLAKNFMWLDESSSITSKEEDNG